MTSPTPSVPDSAALALEIFNEARHTFHGPYECDCVNGVSVSQQAIERIESILTAFGQAQFANAIEQAAEVARKEWTDGSATCKEKKHNSVCHYGTVVHLNDRLRALLPPSSGEAK